MKELIGRYWGWSTLLIAFALSLVWYLNAEYREIVGIFLLGGFAYIGLACAFINVAKENKKVKQ